MRALDDVNLDVHAGEVVALSATTAPGSRRSSRPSRAGPADGGTITFDGSEETVRSPSDSTSLGIAVVYQDLALCDNLDVVENLYLGREARRRNQPFSRMDEVRWSRRRWSSSTSCR